MTKYAEKFTPVFLGSGRCFHTIDWFRSCQQLTDIEPIFITDNLDGEGYLRLLRSQDDVRNLVLIDSVLFKRPTRWGHVWRNLVKLVLVPLQVMRLRKNLHRVLNPFIFAHSSYYAFIASFCNVRYSFTPQGSEVLVRPFTSNLYRYFLLRSVRHAAFTTVDSNVMADRLEELSGLRPHIIQNGIDVAGIGCRTDESNVDAERNLVTSIRGFDSNYRIVDILQARNSQVSCQDLNFCFPFVEGGYERKISRLIRDKDVLHGRLPKTEMYALLKRSVCVISIPKSDSSPRSVYEAIFCGAAVICTKAQYIDDLPSCMRRRIIVVNINDPRWLSDGIVAARQIVSEDYFPSSAAIDCFDQISSMKRFLSLAFTNVKSPR